MRRDANLLDLLKKITKESKEKEAKALAQAPLEVREKLVEIAESSGHKPEDLPSVLGSDNIVKVDVVDAVLMKRKEASALVRTSEAPIVQPRSTPPILMSERDVPPLFSRPTVPTVL